RPSESQCRLQAIRLANNLFGNRLFETGFGLNGQPARDLLGILKHVERINYATSHGNNMEPAVEVRRVSINNVAVASHCTNTLACQGPPFTQMSLTLI